MREKIKRVKTIFGRKKKKVRLCLPESGRNKVSRENELNLSRKSKDLKESTRER